MLISAGHACLAHYLKCVGVGHCTDTPLKALTWHVFISYSRADREFVNRFISNLQNLGVNVWIDQQGLEPRTPDWEQALRDAIRSAKAVLLVASPDSRSSRYVKDELRIAEMYERKVYPVWARGSHYIDCVPMGMGGTQYIDMRDARYETNLAKVVNTLTQIQVVSDESTTKLQIPRGDPRNPYKGLMAFTSKDTGDFFGRDRLIDELINQTDTVQRSGECFLAVLGLSGSGKSSVVMAGNQVGQAHDTAPRPTPLLITVQHKAGVGAPG